MLIKTLTTRLTLIVLSSMSLAPALTVANIITIEPDAYSAGTNLSSISPYVSLSTGLGDPVYAASVYPVDTPTTGPLGTQVFSRAPDSNTEWIYPLILQGPFPAAARNGLVITFEAPVDYVSLLIAETRRDAGCCGDDPVRWFFFDSNDQLVTSGSPNLALPLTYLGTQPGGSNMGQPAYPVWDAQFSHADIHRVVIAGDSEPTTIDRLRFNLVEVPEPGAALLFFFGLLGIGVSRRLASRGKASREMR